MNPVSKLFPSAGHIQSRGADEQRAGLSRTRNALVRFSASDDQPPVDPMSFVRQAQAASATTLEGLEFANLKHNRRRTVPDLMRRIMFNCMASFKDIADLMNGVANNFTLPGLGGMTEDTMATAIVAREMASRNPLTGLRNEEAYLEALGKALLAARSEGTPFVTVMVDIDYFKDVNDNETLGQKVVNGKTVSGYGSHPTGDVALNAVGRALKEALGDEGEAFHLHGEEFTLLIPNKTLEAAKNRLVTVSETVYGLRTNPGFFKRKEDACLQEVFKFRPLALSMGVLAVDQEALQLLKANEEGDDETVITHLQALTDDAMYQAKTHGRNRIYAASADGEARLVYAGEAFKYPPGTVQSGAVSTGEDT